MAALTPFIDMPPELVDENVRALQHFFGIQNGAFYISHNICCQGRGFIGSSVGKIHKLGQKNENRATSDIIRRIYESENT